MKTVKWLIQTTNLKTNNIERFYEALSILGYKYNDFGVIPFTNYITNIENILDDSDIYIVRGGTKFLQMTKEVNSLKELVQENMYDLIDFTNSEIHLKKLRESIDYDINKFDLLNYSKLDLPLLNKDAVILPYEEIKNYSYKESKFIKPSKDLKAFNGGILEPGMSIKEFIINSMHQSFFNKEHIVINNLKNIKREYRFFILNDNIITGSLYKEFNKLSFSNYIPEKILSAAKDYAKLYNPSEIFVMDLAETDEGIFIVEYNCWNCSGLYAVNVSKLVNTISEYKISKR